MLEAHKLKQVMLIIPAYNEEQTVAQVVSEALQLGLGAVVVVDDHSTDRSATVASNAGAEVVSLSENLGAWGAIQTGLRLALRRGFKTAVTLDADGQHLSPFVPSILEPIFSQSANTVVGSCTQRGTRGRHLAWRWLRMLSGLEIDDLTSGMRAYDLPSIKALSTRSGSLPDYQDIGPLLLLNREGLKVKEVPVLMSDRADGKSKIFHSWSRVAYYLCYSTILGVSRRPARRKTKTTIALDQKID